MVIDKAMAGRFISEYKKYLLAIYRPEPGSPEPQRVIEMFVVAKEDLRVFFVASSSLSDSIVPLTVFFKWVTLWVLWVSSSSL